MGDVWSASLPGRFTPIQRTPGTHSIGDFYVRRREYNLRWYKLRIPTVNKYVRKLWIVISLAAKLAKNSESGRNVYPPDCVSLQRGFQRPRKSAVALKYLQRHVFAGHIAYNDLFRVRNISCLAPAT